MAYDSNAYGTSPFDSPTAPTQTAQPYDTEAPRTEALSDQGDSLGPQQTLPAENASAEFPPDLPEDYLPRQGRSPRFHFPKGRMGGLNLLGETVGWLLTWGTVGFFRSYIPEFFLQLCDRVFSPWGMAGGTLLSGLLLGQMLHRYQNKIAGLRTLATAAIEYGESHHRADVQTQIDQLLTEAEEKTKSMGQWLVSWLVALGCLFIIGSFY